MRTTLSGCVVFALVCCLVLVLPAAAANGKIAFMSERDGNKEIYVMNPDGTYQTRLTQNLAEDDFPAWSPDGTRIAYASNIDGDYEIYVMNADGSGVTRLTDNTVSDYFPAWSPDGQQIAYTSGVGGGTEIFVMALDGSSLLQLTESPGNDLEAAWSPDGSKIAFNTYRDGNTEIYVMDPDGTDETRLTNNADEDWDPEWSPDGSKIAFASMRDGNFEIYVMDANGDNQVPLAVYELGDDWYPAWSPDGSQIAFASSRDSEQFEIYVMDADGTNPVRLTMNAAADDNPSWGVLTTPTGIGYTATVAGGQNTVIQTANGVFGTIARGSSRTIYPSAVLSNTGDAPAKVEARFDSEVGMIFGLVSGTNVIPATNFEMGPAGDLVPLDMDGWDVQVATALPGLTELGAKLTIPETQPSGAYSGNVILTFSNV